VLTNALRQSDISKFNHLSAQVIEKIHYPLSMKSGTGPWSDGEAGGTKEVQGRRMMEKGERLVIIGRGGAGGPAAMLSKKLMPGVDVTIISEEERFIVR